MNQEKKVKMKKSKLEKIIKFKLYEILITTIAFGAYANFQTFPKTYKKYFSPSPIIREDYQNELNNHLYEIHNS